MSRTGQRPVVATERGRVRGVVEGEVAAFRGLPYAASPVGALRFAAPRPHPGWSEVRDAERTGPSVPQGPSRLERVMGPRVPDWDEDGCLTLNVWTPVGALTPGGAARAVLVWFHGGGFTSGSGGWDWYDGARLAALGDIVVVTANYRLGPLGYLHLPEIGAENLGSQDQAAVLHWVRDNIAAFGGDAGLVTVGGQSAGAYSALSLALAPETGGLVRRVIAQSGPWGMAPQDPAAAAECAADYLRILGVTGTDPGAELRQLPVERLLAAYEQLAQRARPGDIAPPMYPVLGGPGHPVGWQQTVADGALGDKDVLLGTTEDEMTAFFAFNPLVQALSRDDVVATIRGRAGDMAQAVYDHYAARRPGATPARVLTDLAADHGFGNGVTEIATRRAAQGFPAYVYRFTRRPSPDPHGLGATHCAELPFLFHTVDAYPDAPMLGSADGQDRALAGAFGGALAAFTATGSPNGPGLDPWRPYLPGPAPEVMRFGPSPDLNSFRKEPLS
ncbi:carboxylesterase/lipase family protein [Streptomyces gilvosporeus]|uniref:Carboxylic ester hydrolase n=1 Tax=Streptomyces gilvosporeus TaxID=553510 RepID=A0A1V0TK30_9ACTN|nr:carboxylesterase family protein [Streptomyces gilvosporeus]ARF53284.1 carboxylesterase [Streptomyces gilvosporeus]